MAYWSEVLADSPLGYWRLGESSGTTLVDSSGNGRNGTYSATPTHAPGLIVDDADTCLNAAGTTYAVVPWGTWRDAATFTIEALVNITTHVAGQQIMDSDNEGTSRRFQWRLTGTGQVELLVFTSGGLFTATTSTTLSLGTTYHLAAKFDGSSARVYIGGVEWANVPTTGTLSTAGTGSLSIGSHGATSLNIFNGKIDEAAFYGTALSNARLTTHASAVTATSGPPTATLEGVAPRPTTSISGSIPVGGALAGVAPAPFTTVNVEAQVPVSVALSGSAPLPTSHITASLLVVSDTDLSLESNGYDYSGESTVTWEPNAATPPAGAFPAATPMRRVHHAVSAPTLDAGRPLFAGFGTETITPWCDYLRVTVGGKDVTWFRGVQTVIRSTQSLDPYGDGPASLSFPQISEFEAPGVGDLSWLKKTSRVVINRVVDGAVVDSQDPYYVGIVARDAFSSGPADVAVEGEYMGRMARLLHQPYMMHNPARSLSDHLERVHRKIYRADFAFVSAVDGPLIRARGDRSQSRIGQVDFLLGLSDQQDGDSYTLLPDRTVARNAMRLQLRSMTSVDFTIYAGAHGVKLSDFAADPATNRAYGEGQGKDGGRWGNRTFPHAGYDDDAPDYPKAGGASFGGGTTDAGTVNGDGISLLTRRLWGLGLLDRDDAGSSLFDDEVEDAVNDFRRMLGLPQNGTVTTSLWANLHGEGFNKQSLQGAHFEPLAAKTETVQWLRGPGGNVVGRNPNYNRGVMPVEEFVSYGENVSKRDAKKHARSILARTEVRIGTVTLTSDPAEMSRFDIKGGMTGNFKNLLGTGATGLKVYVSSAERDHTSGSVVLAIATSALHFAEFQSIRQRQVEARQNPAKRAIQAFRRKSTVVSDTTNWESEGPSGYVPRRRIYANQWNKLQVVACERGTLAEMRFVTDNPTRFQVMVTGQNVPERLMDRKIGDPFAFVGTGDSKQNTFQAHAEWLQGKLMAQAYGDPDEPGGFWPRSHMNEAGKVTTHPVTGILRDDASQGFVTVGCFLYVYVWPKDDAWFHGRLKLVPED